MLSKVASCVGLSRLTLLFAKSIDGALALTTTVLVGVIFAMDVVRVAVATGVSVGVGVFDNSGIGVDVGSRCVATRRVGVTVDVTVGVVSFLIALMTDSAESTRVAAAADATWLASTVVATFETSTVAVVVMAVWLFSKAGVLVAVAVTVAIVGTDVAVGASVTVAANVVGAAATASTTVAVKIAVAVVPFAELST